jgi:predicted secreted protein
VDVFGTIESSRVWLLFEPLDHLYGMFQRHGDAAGIVLHSGHPLSLQRFTAAHEFGHHSLGHTFSQDSSRELFDSDTPLQELEAQAFAAEFLMPLPLVNRAQDRIGLPRIPTQLTPIDAYQLSLEMGSSYTATIHHLHHLNKLDDTQLTELGTWQPIDLKMQLGGGQRPGSPRADVWDIADARRSRRLFLRLDDELHVRLPEIPSSGYRWDVEVRDGPEGLELLSDELEPPGLAVNESIGSHRRRHLWWRAVWPVDVVLDLRLVRPWQGADAEPIERLSVPLSVQVPRTGRDTATGISEPQRLAMLQEAA